MITHEKSLDAFSEQITYAIENYTAHGIDSDSVKNIVMGGLGGSGIGAKFTKSFYYEMAKKSIEVISDYHLPAYVSKKTLLVLASYSGETEETLSLFEEGLAAGCEIITICSGGTLQELSKEHGFKSYTVPTGYQPRMAFGFSFTFNLMIIGEVLGIENVQEELQNAVKAYDDKLEWKNSAKQLFEYFKATISNKFVIVADRNSEPTAIRFAQQIQENAKLEAFVNVLPENNHNVLETYYSKLPSNIVLLNGSSNERVDLRFEFLKTVLDKNKIPYATIVYDGEVIPEIYKTVHILDWLSIFLSSASGANNMEVKNISALKDYLTNN
jgi:glucose/mannose-6-phosphate isomerase